MGVLWAWGVNGGEGRSVSGMKEVRGAASCRGVVSDELVLSRAIAGRLRRGGTGEGIFL